MDLLNIGTGKPEALDDQTAVQHLAAGTHMPIGGDRAMVSPDGDLEMIPAGQLQTAVSGGYKVPDQGQLTEFANLAKYGGSGANAFKAFGAGAARGATFGVSDYLLPKLPGGPEAETLAGLKAYQRGPSVAGEITGAVGSAILAPELSPAGLVSKLGKTVTAAALPEAAGAMAQIGAHALGSGAEGLIYGATPTISEAALGDPNATAESLVANVGLGGLLGGALGGIMKAGSLAVPKSVGVAKDAASAGWRTLFGDVAPEKEVAPFFTPQIPGGAVPEAAAGAEMGAAEMAGPDLAAPGPAPAAPAGEVKAGIIPKAIAKVNEALTGTPTGETLQSFADRAAGKGELLTEKQYSEFKKQVIDSLQETYDATQKAAVEAGATVRPQEWVSQLQDGNPALAQTSLGRVKEGFNQTIAEMRAAPDMFPARFSARLDKLLDGLEAGTGADAEATAKMGAADIYTEITRTRKLLDKLIPYGKNVTEENQDAINLMSQLRSSLKKELESEEAWGAAGARTAAFNETTSAQMAAAKEFRKQFMVKDTRGNYKIRPTSVSEMLNQINDPRSAPRVNALKDFFQKNLDHLDQIEQTYKAAPHETFDKDALKALIDRNNAQATRAQQIVAGQPGQGFGGMSNLFHTFANPLGAAAALAKAGFNPTAQAATLANIEKASQKVGFVFSNGMKGIFAPVAGVARKGFGVLSEKLSPLEKADKIKAKINETREHLADPETLVDTLNDATLHGQHAAPQVMAAVQQTALRGLQFLQSKLPVTAPATPFQKAQEPTSAQLAAFDRYYNIVHDPMSIMDELKSGALSKESVEGLKTVYPQLYAQIAQASVEHAAGLDGEVPYRSRLILSQFLGQPLDRSLSPAALQAVQMATAMPQKQQAPAGGAKPGNQQGLSHLTIAQRSATDFQATSLKGNV